MQVSLYLQEICIKMNAKGFEQEIDIPWFHGIINTFSLSLVCVQKPFCIDFYVSFSLFAENLFKDERGSF